jgi:hypothetical protein
MIPDLSWHFVGFEIVARFGEIGWGVRTFWTPSISGDVAERRDRFSDL